MSFINYKTSGFRSNFNPVMGFHESVLPKVNNFINQKVDEFFQLMNINFGDTEFIEVPDTITELEFKATSTELANSYFYELIFNNPVKLDDGSIGETIKYCITFDRDLTPYNKNDFNFGFIKIANRPVLYYILFDLQELIKVSKS